jgi:hypothetical protein
MVSSVVGKRSPRINPASEPPVEVSLYQQWGRLQPHKPGCVSLAALLLPISSENQTLSRILHQIAAKN